MAEPVIVEPRAGVVPPPPDAAPAPTAEGGADLPDDLLKIPAIQAITAGQPAAFSALLESFQNTPEAKIIATNKDKMMEAGFGLYRSLDGAKGVVFNQLFVSPDDIKAADAAGQLDQIAPPFDELNASVAGSGAANPVLAEGERPTGFATGSGAPAAVPMPSGEMPPMPSGAQKTLANKRSANMQPGAPTTGASPGAGRLLNSILKPVL